MCVCVHFCSYIHTYIHTYMYTYLYIMYACMHVHSHTYNKSQVKTSVAKTKSSRRRRHDYGLYTRIRKKTDPRPVPDRATPDFRACFTGRDHIRPGRDSGARAVFGVARFCKGGREGCFLYHVILLIINEY